MNATAEATNTMADYETKWIHPKKKDQSFQSASEVQARNKAIKMSQEFGMAQLGEWETGNGPEDHLIQTWTYENGVMTKNLLMSKENKVITRPAVWKEKKGDDPVDPVPGDDLEIPPALKRSKNEKPRTITAPVGEGLTPPQPKSVEQNDQPESKENDMVKTASAKKPAKASSKTKPAAKATGKAAKTRSATQAKPATKAAPTKPAFVGKAPAHNKAKIIESFAQREGGFRAKLVEALAGNAGKHLLLSDALKAVYGSGNLANAGKLGNVIKGARNDILGKKLPYQIVEQKNEKGDKTIGLFAK